MENLIIIGGTVYIQTAADLSVQELDELQIRGNVTAVKVTGKYNNYGNERPYSISEYKQIRAKLNEYTEGINPEWSKDKKFIYVFRRVSMEIDYDHIAGYPEKGDPFQEEYSEKNKNDCRNLRNGLLEGKCVCAGYAEILRHACSLVDVDCRYVQGYSSNGGCHAWNIVQMEDGSWIEVDPTWSHENGIEYIGDDKETFWQEHGDCKYVNDEDEYFHSRYFNFPLISNLDLNKFINSELGISQEKRYTKEEQARLIELLEARDTKGIDITQEVSDFFQKRNDFEQEIGYTFEQLEEMEISPEWTREVMKTNYDEQTGERIDKKSKIDSTIEQKRNADREFEQEVGYTKEELQNMGLTVREINIIIGGNYDSQTGEKVDRKAKVEQKIQEKSQISNERKIIESASNGMIHPKVLDRMLTSINRGDLSINEALKIIEANRNNLDNPEVEQIKDRLDSQEKIREEKRIKQFHEKFDKDFEEEVGYTIEQIKNMGFTDEEIEDMKAKFDSETGEKLNRRKIVENKIKEKNKTVPENTLKKLYEKLFLRKNDLRESANSLKEMQNELTMNDIEHDADKEEMR